MPSKSLRQKICDIDAVMRNANYWITEWQLNGFDIDTELKLNNANNIMYRLMESLDMDYELHMILRRFYDYHMREVNLIKSRKDK